MMTWPGGIISAGRAVPDRWAALVTLQWPTEWQKTSMAIYGPLTAAEVDALVPFVAAVPGATLQVMPLDSLPSDQERGEPS